MFKVGITLALGLTNFGNNSKSKTNSARGLKVNLENIIEEVSQSKNVENKIIESNNPLNHKGENFYKGVTKSQEKSETAPWLNSDGSRKTDSEISKLGESWSAETWDSFLKDDVGTVGYDADTVSFPYMDTPTIASSSDLVKYLQNLDQYENLEEYLGYAIKTLSKREREFVELKYWKGMTQAEIARKFNVKDNTVSTIRRRALAKLKKCLCSDEFKQNVKALKSLKK